MSSKLKIRNVSVEGGADKEYVLLKAEDDLNLMNYAVLDRTFDENGKVSNVHRHYFRFTNQPVKKNDYVVLWTRKGKYQLTKMQSGEPQHNFFWGSDAAIWNDDTIEKAEVQQVSTVDIYVVRQPKRKLVIAKNQ